MELLKNKELVEHDFKTFNVLSKLFLRNLNGIICEGNKGHIKASHVLTIPKELTSNVICSKLEKIWESKLKQKSQNISYFQCIRSLVIFQVMVISVVYFIIESLRVSQSYFLQNILRLFINNKLEKMNESFYWAAGITMSVFVQWLLHQAATIFTESIIVILRNGTMGLIYKKVIQLRPSSLNYATSDHVKTLITSDTEKIQKAFNHFGYIFIAPLQIVCVTILVWYELGLSCFAIVGLFLLYFVFQYILTKMIFKTRRMLTYSTEKRINVMNEVIALRKEIRRHTLEEYFDSLIRKHRRHEASHQLKISMIDALNNLATFLIPYLMALFVVCLFYILGDSFSIPSVFFVVSLFHAIHRGVFMHLFASIQCLLEAHQASRRIGTFLLQDGIIEKSSSTKVYGNGRQIGASFDDVVASREMKSQDFTIDKLTFEANSKNSLVMLVGPPKSGKTSILLTVLNELYIQSGTLQVNGTIGYASQLPWVFFGSIRQNILFGQVFDETLYGRVLMACHLEHDLKSFSRGDETIVGETATILSGEQKAKISLARAVYSKRDIYLLDDLFSNFDGSTAKYIFDNCVREMMKDKVVILSTSQTQFVEYATEIICLSSNGVHAQGDLEDLTRQHVDIFSVICPPPGEKQWDEDSAIGADDQYLSTEDSLNTLNVLSDISLNLHGHKCRTSRRESSQHELLRISHDDYSTGSIHDTVGDNVTWSTLLKSVFQDFTSTLLLFGFVSSLSFLLLSNYWLAEWSYGEESRRNNHTSDGNYYFTTDTRRNLYVFISITFIGFLLSLVSTFGFFAKRIYFNQKLHNCFSLSILRTPLCVFEVAKNGALPDVFSYHFSVIDLKLPSSMYKYFQYSLLLVGIFTMNCLAVPYLIALYLPMVSVLLYMTNYFTRSYHQIKSLNRTASNPLHTHMFETINGLSTIRAFNLQEKLIQEFHKCQDYQASIENTLNLTRRWFAVRVGLWSVFLAGFLVFATIVAAKYIDVDVRYHAVSLTYTLLLSSTVHGFSMTNIEVTYLMRSLTKILKYIRMNVESDDGTNEKMRNGWPEYGLISAEGASFSYDVSLPYVLKKLFFCIRPMEKVGIVGGVGAGKSSLISMLFRLGHIRGRVMIDGISITDLKLKDLRKVISVVPQEPVLFTGNVRHNLDPYGEFSDGEIWETLEEVHLKDVIMELPHKLNSVFTEAGYQCSVGERKLLYLGKALLRKTKILMIDEANTDVDIKTEALFQQTVREKFRECTVLMISNRLSTIMDCDRVMVLEGGRVVEFDEPSELLKDTSGRFRKLVGEAGRKEARRLELLAEESKQLRHVLLLQNQIAYPGSHITMSKTKAEIIDHFGTRVIYETSL